MSEHDLPDRLAKYGGDHVTLKRIALTREQTRRPAVVPRIRQEERTRATSGSSAISASDVGNSTRSTRTICAPSSRTRSRARSSRSRGSAAIWSTRPSRNRCARSSINGTARHDRRLRRLRRTIVAAPAAWRAGRPAPLLHVCRGMERGARSQAQMGPHRHQGDADVHERGRQLRRH